MFSHFGVLSREESARLNFSHMIGNLSVTGKIPISDGRIDRAPENIESGLRLLQGFPNRRVPVFFYLLEAERFAEIITFRAAYDVESPVTEII